MKYFSGFSLQHEESLFKDYLIENDTTVAGFSYGAQQALEYAYASKERIDRLIFLSPAFFQTQKASFVRTQLRYFEAGQEAYVKQFLENVAYPSKMDLKPYLKKGTKEELHALLTYVWEAEKIQTLLDRGVTIEVFLGTLDKIILYDDALGFFRKLCTTYSIENAGHILEIK
jgi:pimeloyl-ACP methyl ester carboxylesterase